MTPTFNEWSAAKELLTFLAKLVSLQPGANLLLQSEEETTIIAAGIFNRPFGSSSERFSHAVHLLPTLQVAQSKMAHWIAILPVGEKRSANPFSPAAENRTAHDPKGKQEPISKLPTHSTKSELLSTKAERFVKEVRIAIQTLSTSSFLGDPKPAPLRAALAKLKPMIDEFVEALSKSSLDSHQEGSFTPFKHQASFSRLRKEKNESRIPLSLFRESSKTAEKTAVRIHITKTPSDSVDTPKEKEAGRASYSKSASPPKMQPSKTPDDLPDISRESGESKKSAPDSFLRPSRNRSVLWEGDEKRTPVAKDPPSLAKTETCENPRAMYAPIPNFRKSLADLEWGCKASFQNEETGRRAQDRPPAPITLPHPVTGQNQRSLETAKKKKQKRYFFKDEEAEDDSSSSRD